MQQFGGGCAYQVFLEGWEVVVEAIGSGGDESDVSKVILGDVLVEI